MLSQSKRLGTLLVAIAVLPSLTGCFATRAVSQARDEGPAYSDRQWFTLGGLVPLSPPAGRDCMYGFSTVDSRMSGTDWLINAGLGLAGGIVGGVACGGLAGGNSDPLAGLAVSASCATAFSAAVPFLIGSRTVTYTCAEGPNHMDYMPPRQGGYRPEGVPPQQQQPGYAPPPAQRP